MTKDDWDEIVEDVINAGVAYAKCFVSGAAIGKAVVDTLAEVYEESNRALPNKEYYIDDD